MRREPREDDSGSRMREPKKFVFLSANQCGLFFFICWSRIQEEKVFICFVVRCRFTFFVLIDSGALGQSSTSGGTCKGSEPRARRLGV